jgi:hypothetical protein
MLTGSTFSRAVAVLPFVSCGEARFTYQMNQVVLRRWSFKPVIIGTGGTVFLHRGEGPTACSHPYGNGALGRKAAGLTSQLVLGVESIFNY